MIFPVKRGLVEEVKPEICALESDAELAQAYYSWADSRRAFNRDLKIPGSPAQAQKWQKDYFRGNSPGRATVKPEAGGEREGEDPAPQISPPGHRTKLKLREFEPER
jgi:hypothetical protein